MAAKILRQHLPGLDDPIISYLDGYVGDPDADPSEDVLATVVRPMLESFYLSDPSSSTTNLVDDVCKQIAIILEEKNGSRGHSAQNGLMRLDKVVDMKKTELSKTMGFGDAVDLGLGGKAGTSRTTVDVKKLEKQEAKTRAKLAKRAQRDLYESSKLVEAAKKQQSYEEMFLKVNPLDMASSKGKNKDIHLPSIDVNFGSNRILSNASLTLAHGRRYGLIGRNGVGKSTLLRHMALREVPIPMHITLLYVEQEIAGDDTPALEAVLRADVWREKLLSEERDLNARLTEIEQTLSSAEGQANALDLPTRQKENEREELQARLGEVQNKLVEMEAETGPARAASLLAGLGFSQADQQKPTKNFSGGWRMRLALARALFCKPDLLMLDEPSNMLDLNAIAWLENYLQSWAGTLLVVSHDRAFLNQVATDIIHQHSERLDYYKGNFDQFYETREERRKNQQREYETQLQYRQHLQAFIDRWRYNANRAAQAQSKIKILEKLPDLEPPEADDVVKFSLPETEKVPPPLLQLDNVTFGYDKDRILLRDINFDVGMDSRVAVVGPNGAGKSTLMKLLISQISPLKGDVKRNSRLRIGFFTQHHIDQLDLSMSPVAFLASKFPGKTEQEYRAHLGAFGITGMTGLQKIATLSGGQKSRVAFAQLSLQKPHVLLLDEPTNHLDIEGLDALMAAINAWNGGVIVISHDQTFINRCCKELWMTGNGTVKKLYCDVSEYKRMILEQNTNDIKVTA